MVKIIQLRVAAYLSELIKMTIRITNLLIDQLIIHHWLESGRVGSGWSGQVRSG